MNYTLKVELLAKELEVDDSVAEDILYLRSLENRIIRAAKIHSNFRDFPVYHSELESQLELLGV
jgi:hypothetical protein